jgi:hypothetical protein
MKLLFRPSLDGEKYECARCRNVIEPLTGMHFGKTCSRKGLLDSAYKN